MSDVEAKQNGKDKSISKPKAAFPDKQEIMALVDEQNFLRIRVTAGAKNDGIGLPSPDAPSILLVRVAAPPKDGKANKAAIKLIAAALGLPKSRITLLAGQAGRGKMIQIEPKRDEPARDGPKQDAPKPDRPAVEPFTPEKASAE